MKQIVFPEKSSYAFAKSNHKNRRFPNENGGFSDFPEPDGGRGAFLAATKGEERTHNPELGSAGLSVKHIHLPILAKITMRLPFLYRNGEKI